MEPLELASQPVEVAPTEHSAPGAALFTIRELASEFGVTLRALRFYESKGLLAPQRFGNARLFTRADRERLALILRGKQLGFTLKEIRGLISAQKDRKGGASLPLSPRQCIEQIRLLSARKREIETALAELQQNYSVLNAALGAG